MPQHLTGLTPTTVWEYFGRICAIPHDSGKESDLRDAVRRWAADCNCPTEVDDVGNTLIRIPATPGCEKSKTVTLQAHLDMVCEKNTDTEFNFDRDPIPVQIDGEWVTANGTSLGADNGIGLAMGLAIMQDKTISHGPLELLCTVDEETGLNGAMGLRRGWLRGDILINTDTEEEGVLIIGCAGGFNADIRIPIRRDHTDENRIPMMISISQLWGGHSGMDIHKNMGNAIHLMAMYLLQMETSLPFKLVSVNGGLKHNAIPREAFAHILVFPGDVDALHQCTSDFQNMCRRWLVKQDHPIRVTATHPHALLPAPIVDEDARRLTTLLMSMPHGVSAMSESLPGIVQSSGNLARIATEQETAHILFSARSLNRDDLTKQAHQLKSLTSLARGQCDIHTGYPPWEPNFNASIISTARSVYERTSSTPLRITCIHAGLECGIIRDRYPQMEVISLGPSIDHPHSPSERVNIESVARVYRFLKDLLSRLTRL